MVLGLTHGDLYIDGYDYTKEGIVSMFEKLSTNSFVLSCRASLAVESIVIFKDERKTVYDFYRDVELGIRELTIDVKVNESRIISLDKMQLYLVYSDDSILDRTINHLDVTKDLVEQKKDPTFLEENANYFTIGFSAVSGLILLILIYLRIKKPELFRFRE